MSIEDSFIFAVMITLLTVVTLVFIACALRLFIANRRTGQLRLLEKECDIKDVLEFAILHRVSEGVLNGTLPFRYCDGAPVGRFLASFLFGKITEFSSDQAHTEEVYLNAIARALVPLTPGDWCREFYEGLKDSRHPEYAEKIKTLLDEKLSVREKEKIATRSKMLLAKRRRRLGLPVN